MHEPLPKVVADIVRVAGSDAAWAIVHAHGGQRVFVPAHPDPESWIVKLVGLEAAEKICDHFRVKGSGATVLIPMAKWAVSRERLARALDSGLTAREAAAQAGLHERTVYRARQRRKAGKKTDPRQNNLF